MDPHLPPSKVSRRAICPGSRYLEQTVGVNPNSEYAEEGKLAHECAEKMLLKNCGSVIDFDSTKYTPEMQWGAEIYVGYIKKIIENLEVLVMGVEEAVHIDVINSHCSGRIDAYVFIKETNQLHIFDYKFGRTPVYPYENLQLLEYACGLLHHLNEETEIFLHIVQPRSLDKDSTYGKSWSLSYRQLKRWIPLLQEIEAKASSNNAPLVASLECIGCTAKYSCPISFKGAIRLAESINSQGEVGVLNYKSYGKELAYLEDAKKYLDMWITTLKDILIFDLQSGKISSCEGYELVQQPGRLEWNLDKIGVIKSIANYYGINLTKSEELITPLQAKQAGIPQDILNKYSERSKSSLKLKRITKDRMNSLFKDINT